MDGRCYAGPTGGVTVPDTGPSPIDDPTTFSFLINSINFRGLIGRGGGGGGGQKKPTPTPTPTPTPPKQDLQALFDKVKKDCLAREKAKADRARSAYRNRYSSRLFWSMGTGALVGVARGGYAGAVGGEFLEPLGGGVPGAIVGGVVGGIFGAASGVLTSVVKEPIYRAAYNHFTYNPALNFSYLDCDAEARTAVATAQMGGRR
jgi:hypothetical protein